jgi:hypothetical protein
LTPGDVVRSAHYANAGDRSSFGTTLRLDSQVLPQVNLLASYRWMDNTQIPHAPRHLGTLQVRAQFHSQTWVTMSAVVRSSLLFRELRVSSGEDELHRTGFSGTIPAITTVDMNVYQELHSFFTVPHMILQVEILNVFNEPDRFLPVGNSFNTTFLFTMKVTL